MTMQMTPVNAALSERTAQVPEVGMGATCFSWSDRRAYTVVEVKSPTHVVVQRDSVTLGPDGYGKVYEPNPEGGLTDVRLGKKGWTSGGSSWALGYRDEYYDLSF